MSTPAPRPPVQHADPIAARMDGLARNTAHDPLPGGLLVLTMTYRTEQPYEVIINIADAYPRSGGYCDSTDWMVSREILCNAAVWQTPAGMGDFRAVPMAEQTTQLIFLSSDPDHKNGEALYVDVRRKSLLVFLERTLRAVKPGQEGRYLNITDELLVAFMEGNNR